MSLTFCPPSWLGLKTWRPGDSQGSKVNIWYDIRSNCPTLLLLILESTTIAGNAKPDDWHAVLPRPDLVSRPAPSPWRCNYSSTSKPVRSAHGRPSRCRRFASSQWLRPCRSCRPRKGDLPSAPRLCASGKPRISSYFYDSLTRFAASQICLVWHSAQYRSVLG